MVWLRTGETLRFRAGHLDHADGVIQWVVWDERAADNRAVAMFPVAEVLRIFAQDALLPDPPEPTPPA